MREHSYYIYIMSNASRTVLYLGVSNDLLRRVCEHRESKIPGFAQRYHCNRLLYYEHFDDVEEAIAREKQLKGWRRSKKEALILGENPRWEDLAISVLGLEPMPGRSFDKLRMTKTQSRSVL